jgi:uncharacterized protein YhbP (UPF0306 family)
MNEYIAFVETLKTQGKTNVYCTTYKTIYANDPFIIFDEKNPLVGFMVKMTKINTVCFSNKQVTGMIELPGGEVYKITLKFVAPKKLK